MSLVAKYRKLKPQPKSGWEWNDDKELNLKITKLITDDIDFGTHTSTEKQKNSFYSQIARKIGELVIDIEYMAEFMIEDKIYESFEEFYKDSGEKILEQRIYTMVLKCPYCDEYIHIGRRVHVGKDFDSTIRYLCVGENKKGEKAKDNCFQFKKYLIEVKTKSDKFVIMNDIREYIKTPDRYKESDINSLGGTIKASQLYAEDGVMTFFVGNSGVTISQDVDKENTFYLYENGFFDEDEDDNFPELEDKGHVSCGLWWVMGADQSDLDMEELMKNEYDKPTIIDVIPNSTYILEYDMTEERLQKDQDYESKCFKFYKK